MKGKNNMEVNKELVKELVNNLKENCTPYGYNTLPIYSSHCYFCLLHNSNCDECEYVEKHGICGSRDSVWAKLTSYIYNVKKRKYPLVKQAHDIKEYYIESMLKVDTVDKLMKLKSEMLISLANCYYSDDGNYFDLLIKLLKDEYWQGISENVNSTDELISLTKKSMNIMTLLFNKEVELEDRIVKLENKVNVFEIHVKEFENNVDEFEKEIKKLISCIY